jgi:hypothetical protein
MFFRPEMETVQRGLSQVYKEAQKHDHRCKSFRQGSSGTVSKRRNKATRNITGAVTRKSRYRYTVATRNKAHTKSLLTIGKF